MCMHHDGLQYFIIIYIHIESSNTRVCVYALQQEQPQELQQANQNNYKMHRLNYKHRLQLLSPAVLLLLILLLYACLSSSS